MFGSIWGYFYTSFLRYWLKWFIRQVTGKCELQRICAGYKPGAPRTTKAEYSLKNSKSKLLRAAVDVEEDGLEKHLDLIMREKNVKTQRDPTSVLLSFTVLLIFYIDDFIWYMLMTNVCLFGPRFKVNLKLCLLQITGYRNLFTSVEELRKENFDSDKVQHEEMLLKLWDLLMPEVKLESRVTKQWGDIGFQGDDPKTDFRGMGMLGLTNLVFFSENYTEEARQVLSHANHPKLGYSYAIVGINLTEMAYSLLKSGALKPHFYNTVSGRPQLQHLHQLFCYLVYKFDKFWVEEEPESIMEFNHYREKFHDNIKIQLLDPAVALTMTDSPRSN
ncbi:ELMO domain-containing protein 2 isoform X1 [Oncorhynchus kisutch]|uniref:ELMO domain-containing protein 2 isoform X1 n=1 Tax=Oncorhynchus kisutch TaxID=8019 RepID=UPI0012DC0C3C|nr:ELMO domain-containing protein 2 isoform X1 [Oncorhynchus kisutch]